MAERAEGQNVGESVLSRSQIGHSTYMVSLNSKTALRVHDADALPTMVGRVECQPNALVASIAHLSHPSTGLTNDAYAKACRNPKQL